MVIQFLYTPDLMPEAEIQATFVAHRPLIDELVSMIAHQPDRAGVQHVILLAPWGMGKTTVLLMLRMAMQERALTAHWQAIKLLEGSYGIGDLADFWLAILTQLALETHDTELSERVEHLKTEHPESNDLQKAALAVIKEWRQKHQKRLVVLIENFDVILEQINDEYDNARLCDVLMNDGTLMLIGGATTCFHAARAHDQPLSNCFKIYPLRRLEFAEIHVLLRQCARVEQRPAVTQLFKDKASCVRALAYFTSGNPRLVLMLSSIIMQLDISHVRDCLETLLDQMTPFYKAKTENLAPQQRQVLDYVARASGRTHAGITPTEIALATRLSVNQVSSQLKRLSDYAYVRAANVRGRISYYILSDLLYAVWYQRCLVRHSRESGQWLIHFLQVWYAIETRSTDSEPSGGRFGQSWHASHVPEVCHRLGRQRDFTASRGEVSVHADIKGNVFRSYPLFDDLGALQKAWLSTETKPHMSETGHNGRHTLDNLGEPEATLASSDDARERNAGRCAAWFSTYFPRLSEHDMTAARHDWCGALNALKRIEQDKWHEIASVALVIIARQGHLKLARQLIADAALEESLFPLTRALDYVLRGDEALIEKLSPEVRPIVEEVARRLHQAPCSREQDTTQAPVPKSKAGSRRRIAKHLR